MRPKKRSLTIRGHRTSVSLEDPFWDALREISDIRGLPINKLTAEIDAARDGDTGLASAIRLFILDHYRRAAAVGAPATQSPHSTATDDPQDDRRKDDPQEA